MTQDDVYNAIKARLPLLEEAMHDAEQAMKFNSRPELRMAIRDMGFHIFEMSQFLMRLPEHSAELTK